MKNLKTTTVRDLRYHFSRVEHLLREGNKVQVCKRKRVIAHLIPVPSTSATLGKRPDFLKRMKKIFGHKRLKTSGAELIAWDRGRF